ncbi:hypothetical protein [Vibrio phage P23]|nr:hypothetical protein [Vibrio phage P23]
MNLLELQSKIHAQNVEMGWWDKPRSFSVITNLGVSENSEAMEGDRKNLKDDHLTKYPMVVVELADSSIRSFDYLGSIDNTEFPFINDVSKYYRVNNFQFNLALSTRMLTQAWFWTEIEPNKSNAIRCIKQSILINWHMIQDLGFDPLQIILEKVEYNKHRADHKRENREKDGGKKY